MLRREGYVVGGILGDLAQHARLAARDAFRKGTTPLLVTTDVAARGLDIPNIGTVINCSSPLTVEDYVHRIGRTGEVLRRFPSFLCVLMGWMYRSWRT